MTRALERATRWTPFTVLFPMAVWLAIAGTSRADSFFVATDGRDDKTHDGKSAEAAWASLAFACDQVPAGNHAIHVLPGTYVATRTAYPKNGLTIVGRQPHGPDVSRIIAAKDWKMRPLVDPEGHEGFDEYLIAASAKRPDGVWLPVANLTVKNLELCSHPENRITGGFYCRDGTQVTLQDLNVHDFRWNGLRVEFSKQVEIHHCQLTDASTEVLPGKEGGLLRTRWIEDSRIHHNRIVARKTAGYGYKGGGHRKVRIDHNYVSVNYFALESPFEDEFEFEIDHNHFDSCISIPRERGADPTKHGFQYGIRVHHNYLTDSYTIEGPRGYLEFDHNWVHVERTGGRIYTHHGAISEGPIHIHHNVIENVDRNLIWMNEGRVAQLTVEHNTILCADRGDQSGFLFDAWSQERLDRWTFRNNVVIASYGRPRQVHSLERGIPGKMLVESNLFVDCLEVPAKNFQNRDPGFVRTGPKPGTFYMPRSAESFVVDRGQELGAPFQGKAPDLGAFEWGEAPWTLDEIPPP